MGTRNLTQVVHKGKTVISHYCQWDGMPDSAGRDQLAFLNGSGFHEREVKYSGYERKPSGRVLKFDFKTFVANLQKVKILTPEECEALWDAEGATNGCATLDVSNSFRLKHYTLHRDCTGAELLGRIQAGDEVKDVLEMNFAQNSLFCEWVYVLNLDRKVWEIHRGFNKSKLKSKDRFYRPDQKPDKQGYYACKPWMEFKLSTLPATIDKVVAKYKKENGDEE
jgi:hypothetical protein